MALDPSRDPARGRGRHSPSTPLVFKVTFGSVQSPLSEIPGSAPVHAYILYCNSLQGFFSKINYKIKL